MIRAKLDAAGLKLWVDGHAGYAPAGQDIVCAAVSALVYTLAGNLERMLRPGEYTLEFRQGHAFIEARPPENRARDCKKLFGVIAHGLGLLAAQYGHHMRMEGAETARFSGD